MLPVWEIGAAERGCVINSDLARSLVVMRLRQTAHLLEWMLDKHAEEAPTRGALEAVTAALSLITPREAGAETRWAALPSTG